MINERGITMFFHVFSYRFKCLIRDRQAVFWTLLFPIILATLFNMTLKNVSSDPKFEEINIAVINNEDYQRDTAFQGVLKSVSDLGGEKKDELFHVKLTTAEEAEELLKNNKISGYFVNKNGYQMIVKNSGINQTIMKSFLDNYLQSSSTAEAIMKSGQTADHQALFKSLSDRQEYLKAKSAGKSSPDTVVIYFYALLAMTCLYGSFPGMQEVNAIQANLSQQAARINMVPVHKMKIFLSSVFAAATVQFISILIVLSYLVFVIKINFGPELPLIILTCLIGCFTGVSFGACVSSLIKKGDGMKIAITLGTTMLGCFLSGMMNIQIKYVIVKNVPVLSYINPVNLVTDAFYSLYYYNTYSRYLLNIGLLLFFTAVFCLITYFVIRRQKYASI